MDNKEEPKIPEWLFELSSEDVHAIVDMVKMYQVGKKAAIKAVVAAIIGAIITAIGGGILHWLKSAAIITGAIISLSLLY